MSKRQWIKIYEREENKAYAYGTPDPFVVVTETVEVMELSPTCTLVCQRVDGVGEDHEYVMLTVAPCPLHEIVPREEQGE